MATMSRWAIGSPATAGARIATSAAPRSTARPNAARRSRQSSLTLCTLGSTQATRISASRLPATTSAALTAVAAMTTG